MRLFVLGIVLLSTLLTSPACTTAEAPSDVSVQPAKSPEPVVASKPLALETVTAKYLAMEDTKIDLIEASLDVSELAFGPVDRAKVYQWLDESGKKIKARVVTTTDAQSTLEAFKQVFYKELGLAATGDLQDVEHSFINKIVEDKIGQCVGMSTTYIALGERAGLDFRPITAPKHVFVRYHKGDLKWNVETLDKGNIYSDRMVTRRAKALFRQVPSKMHFREATRKEMVAMMVNALAVMRARAGEIKPAIEAIEASIRLAPDLEAHYANLGVLYRLMGKYEESIKMSRKAIEKAENLDSAHLEIAAVHFIQDRFDKALPEVQAYAEQAAILPAEPEVTGYLVNVREYARAGKPEEEETLKKAEAFVQKISGVIAAVKRAKLQAFVQREKALLGMIPAGDTKALIARLEGLCPNEQEQTIYAVARALTSRRSLTIPYRFSYVFQRNGQRILLRKRSRAEAKKLAAPIEVRNVNEIRNRMRALISNIPANVVERYVQTLTQKSNGRVQSGPVIFQRTGDHVYITLAAEGPRPFIDAESVWTVPKGVPSAFRVPLHSESLHEAVLADARDTLRARCAKFLQVDKDELPDPLPITSSTIRLYTRVLKNEKALKQIRVQTDAVLASVRTFLQDPRAQGAKIPIDRADALEKFMAWTEPSQNNIEPALLLAQDAGWSIRAEIMLDRGGQSVPVLIDTILKIAPEQEIRFSSQGSSTPQKIETEVRPHFVLQRETLPYRDAATAYYLIRLSLTPATQANIRREVQALSPDSPTFLFVQIGQRHNEYNQKLSAHLAISWLKSHTKQEKVGIAEADLHGKITTVKSNFNKHAQALEPTALIAQYEKAPHDLFIAGEGV